MNLNEALRRFDLAEANLAKLDRVWTRMESLIPDSVAFVGGSPEDREYRNLAREFRVLVDALPKIDDWTITAEPYDLNVLAQDRLDALEIGEIGAQVAVDQAAHAPGDQIDEYRHRLSRKRHELVRRRLEELIAEADRALAEAVAASGVISRSDHSSARTEHLDRFERLVGEVDRILGGSPRIEAWTRLQRHLNFALGVDLLDINEFDWPEVKRDLRERATEHQPHDVGVADIGTLVASQPRGSVSTALNWSALDDERFERLMFSVISSAEGYENPDWLMHTNAPDRARDLSVVRVRHDALGGVIRHRLIIQCKHWQSKSVAVKDIASALAEVISWEPPVIASLVIATSGRFTADAVKWAEQHNSSGKRPEIEIWPDSHLERLLAQRPHLVVDFGLR